MSITAKIRSFTLVELLIVIAIIGVLAGILLSVFGDIPDEAKKAKASSRISQIAAAISNFKNDFGFYPPDGTQADLQDQGSAILLEFLDGDGILPERYMPSEGELGSDSDELITLLDKAYITPPKNDMGDWSPGVGASRRGENFEPSERPEILDPWGNPYQYVRYSDDNGTKLTKLEWESTKREETGFPDPREEDNEIQPQNATSFDLWSVGPNPNDRGDDVTNWK